jgi:2-C-methyl-D-erythritol 4-phosphate cytidylyltransferase
VAAVALIVAAGRGERLGSSGPKALVVVHGRPMLQWSIDALAQVVDEVVVALPDGVQAPPGTLGVAGGAHRSLSVRAALAASTGDPVIVHDAARPLVSADLARACLAELDRADVAIAAAPVTDTVKEIDGAQRVVRTLDRARLWAVQTPQVFRRAVLERALGQADEVLAAATDDASLAEAQGASVHVVAASPENIKVTTPLDLALAEMLLARRC